MPHKNALPRPSLNRGGDLRRDPAWRAQHLHTHRHLHISLRRQSGLWPVAEHESRTCLAGLVHPTHRVCCNASCGACGGRGCSKRPGGPRLCCMPAIMRDGRPCQSAQDVGCTLEADPPANISLDYLQVQQASLAGHKIAAPAVRPTSRSTAIGTSRVEGSCMPPSALIGMTRLLGSADAESGDSWCYQGGRSADRAACEARPSRTAAHARYPIEVRREALLGL